MSFDPKAFDTIEALNAQKNKEADRAQIDAKIAKNGVDFAGAKDLMYGDLKPRTPEEIEAAKVAEANENNPDINLSRDLDAIDSDGEDKKNQDIAPTTQRSRADEIRKRIAVRSGEGEKPQEADNTHIDSLDSSEKRKENTQLAEDLFFSKQHLADQVELISKGNPVEKEQNSQWVEANLGEEGAIHDSFKRVEGNFILPEGIEGNSLEEVFSKHPDRIGEVNQALSDAIELEVCAITNGKVNYDTIAVDKLVVELHDPKCPPLEKIQKFAEIHTKVQTSVAQGGKSQTEAFKKKQALSAENNRQERTFQNTKIAEVTKNNIKSPTTEEVPKNKEIEEVEPGEVFTSSKQEIAKSGSEQNKESA